MIANTAALGAAFVAGISTSVGPCAAPRYLALIGSVHSSRVRDRATSLGSFVGGLATSYAAFAFIAGAVGVVVMHSRELFAGLAIAFCASGVLTMVARTSCVHREPDVHAGSGFLAGLSSGLIVSPCCAPFVAGTGMLAAASGSPADALVLLASFLIGHLGPVLVVGVSSLALPSALPFSPVRSAITTIGGTCSLALGLYFGLNA